MSICQTIRERYPISYKLPVVSGAPLALTYAEGLPEELEKQVRTTLARFALPVDNNAALCARICQAQLPGTGESCLALSYNNNHLYFADGDPCESLAWTLYALTQGLPFLNVSLPMKLRAAVYSASQQSLASSLLSNVRYWQNEITPETLENCLDELLGPHAQAQCRRVPLIGWRPVTEEGWQLISKSKGLLARNTTYTLQALAARLYGQTDCFEELSAFMKSLKEDAEFQRELNDICAALLKRLCSLPPTDLEFSLEEVINARKAKLREDAKQAKERVALCLRNRLTLKRIDPADAFAQADAERTALAAILIEGRFLSALQKRLPAELAKVLPAAQAGIWSWNESLQDFCRIDSLEKPQNIGWDFFRSPDSRRLRCRHDGWDAQRLFALQANAGTLGPYNREVWFCAPPVRALCSEDFRTVTQAVGHLPPSLMVALMSEYL